MPPIFSLTNIHSLSVTHTLSLFTSTPGHVAWWTSESLPIGLSSTQEWHHCLNCLIATSDDLFSLFLLQEIIKAAGDRSTNHPISLSKRDTWDLGGNPSGDRGSKALGCAGLDGEGVGGSWVQTHKEVMGFIPEFEHFSPLAGQVGVWIQWANSLVVNLCDKAKSKHLNAVLSNQGIGEGQQRQGGEERQARPHVTELLGTV